MKSYKELILKSDFNTLIILDALRYDLFEKWSKEILGSGYLEKVKAPISWSNVFPKKFEDCVLYTANPHGSLKGRFSRTVDLWKLDWSSELGTVPPWSVNKRVLENKGKEKRMVIVYLQPHGPWIGKKKLTTYSKENLHLGQDVRLRELFKKDPFGYYESNLKLVLRYVAALLENLNGKIIISTDHGECLGEGGKYLHTPMYNDPSIHEVPWWEMYV